MKKIVVFILSVCFVSAAFADMRGPFADLSPDCMKDFYTALVRKSEIIVVDEKSPTKFCFDIKSSNASKDLIEDFKLLDSLGVFDELGCVINEKKNSTNEDLLARFIKKNLESEINVFARVNSSNNQAALVYTNSDLKYAKGTALSKSDKLQIAGFSVGTIALGALISEQAYKGQADKRKHWQVGAIISGVTTGATYFLLEEMGAGDMLGLSKNTKKGLIMLAGPIMGTIAGILKEVYDRKHRNIHTPDANDAIATSLGSGGAMFAVTFAL